MTAAVATASPGRPPPVAAAGPGRIAVVCFGFAADRIRRQPWHVAHGLAKGFAANGHPVRMLTDSPPEGEGAPSAGLPYEVERVPALFSGGGRPHPDLGAAVRAFAPARLFIVTGALRLARLGPLRDLGAPATLVLASPRAAAAEFRRLDPATWWREWDVLRGPLLDAVVPGWALRRGLARSGAASLLYLSEAARARYGTAGLPDGPLVVPQVDVASLPPPLPVRPAWNGASPRPRIAYLGPALDLRGAGLALSSFERAVEAGLDAELLLLLRPDGGRAGLLRLVRRVRRSPHRARIRCATRMLSAAELRDRLAGCRVCLLPFKVPVSEVPLVVLEAGLSGRRVVTLEAPGVSEYARALGGIVARSPADLPAALAEACALPPPPRPDLGPWTRWELAVAPLTRGDAGRPHPLAAYRFVGLVGVDGSGKTFLLDRLSAGLVEAGIDHRHVWSRFRNYLSKPLLGLARLTGHNVKVRVGDVRIGYHEFGRSRPLAWLFLALQVLDNAVDILVRYRLRPGAGPILGDRCVLDTLVDLAVDTGMDDLVVERLGPPLAALLPRPRLVVLVSRSPRLVGRDRPDALLDRDFARRRALYRRLAARFALPVVENDGTPEAAAAEILRLAAEGTAAATAASAAARDAAPLNTGAPA